MTLETLQKRIEGKQKAIESLNKKIERIEAAKATGWEKNPYYYDEGDLISANKDLESAKKALSNYQDMLRVEQEKRESRNVKVLVDFLEDWKKRSIEYFLAERAEYAIAVGEYKEQRGILNDKMFGNNHVKGFENLKKVRQEMNELDQQFKADWAHVTQFNRGSLGWSLTMQKYVEEEKNRKYDDIIERTNAIAGKIIDATGLAIGPKGDLNGVIIGEKGKVKVETIGAGGYNDKVILDSGRKGQRFHFRTLIHEVN